MIRTTVSGILTRLLHLARTELALLSGLLVVALGIWAFAGLADETGEAGNQAFDQAVLAAMRPNPDPSDAWGPWWLQVAAGDITALGGIAVLGLFATVAVGFLLIQRKRLSALMLVLGLTGGVALSEGLKGVFGRARPPSLFQAVETINASFPSGHALLSTVFYLTVGVLVARTLPRRRLKTFVLGTAVLIALLVGTTRVYLAAHWATDVLAGWSVGAAWAMSLWVVASLIERRQRARHAALQDAPASPSELADPN
ncbi:phosphatase PAP2 family protein [uncultured Brevundimonas sp.]|uniref:phosphatase PAP2 family protein n=1 Tax=uncultured Brevundimonas sp. TaxID=213418 RepID=UPI0030EE40F3|tara:strand:- start:771 stop:1538 length:768 start_codon:yes stop_codon:yes gene_type:complete